tara:strand:- start:73 stop:291 length:219 start_codon:yes stop_codon:yes gene_type:complete
MVSCNCQAICIQRGQLSLSVNGAFQFLGSPVVSVQKLNTSQSDFRIKKSIRAQQNMGKQAFTSKKQPVKPFL